MINQFLEPINESESIANTPIIMVDISGSTSKKLVPN